MKADVQVKASYHKSEINGFPPGWLMRSNNRIETGEFNTRCGLGLVAQCHSGIDTEPG